MDVQCVGARTSALRIGRSVAAGNVRRAGRSAQARGRRADGRWSGTRGPDVRASYHWRLPTACIWRLSERTARCQTASQTRPMLRMEALCVLGLSRRLRVQRSSLAADPRHRVRPARRPRRPHRRRRSAQRPRARHPARPSPVGIGSLTCPMQSVGRCATLSRAAPVSQQWEAAVFGVPGRCGPRPTARRGRRLQGKRH